MGARRIPVADMLRVAVFAFAWSMVLSPGESIAGRTPNRLGVEEEAPPPPPYMELAQRALVEGDLDAAIRVLKSAQTCWAARQEKCGFTKDDYDSLAGVVYLERGQTEKAARSLERVVRRQPNRTMVWFYLGQARLQLSQYRKAANALTEAASIGSKMPQYHGMLVRAWKGTNEDKRARVALEEGLRQFPADAPLLYEGTTLYLSRGLFVAARDLARRYAQAQGDNPCAALFTVAESYRKKGWLRETIISLEEATLLCDGSSDAATRLAYAYAENAQPLPAARLFERLSLKDATLLSAASEQYRLAGHFLEAQCLAMGIEDDAKRRTQLAVISLQTDSFDTVVQILLPDFNSGALDEQGTFRLTYAALRSGHIDLAEKMLIRLKNDQREESLAQLREAISRCKTTPWDCW
ncbi:MAG: tetratricopeptide repeat protein [Deltaproteobacteria bacterium]|nr:tetratricopeptide repeat protein [Deltaproteobacteria bacterium]